MLSSEDAFLMTHRQAGCLRVAHQVSKDANASENPNDYQTGVS